MLIKAAADAAYSDFNSVTKALSYDDIIQVVVCFWFICHITEIVITFVSHFSIFGCRGNLDLGCNFN